MGLDQINLDDYVITRKRKKYKFAKFALATNCYELDEWQPRAVDVIEIGAGDGLFSVELAMRHPDQTFLAFDVKADRLQKGAYEAETKGLTNISFVRARADQLEQVVPSGSVQSLWITFPDPFPKNGSAGRRLTHPTYLSIYSKILKSGSALHLKHDNPSFFQWSLEQLVSQGWHIDALSFDVHASELNEDAKTLTTYERRWLAEGLHSQFVKAYLIR